MDAVTTDRAGTGSISHRTFVAWLLGAVFAAITSIGAFNWYVDATGVTNRVTKWRIADNAEVRSEKLDLYEAMEPAPDVLLLGSSRTMKFEPSTVRELTGDRAFNAAVSGGVPRDALLFTKLVEQRQADAFPHLVWGLDVDAFRDKQLRDGLSTDPRMQQFVARDERLATALASAGALTELQTLKATVRSLRAGGRDGGETGGDERAFAADGFQSWSLPFPTTPAMLDRAVRRQVAQYAGFIFERDAYTRIEPEPFGEFEEVVRIANEHGDRPTIFLTPYHPLAEQLLSKYDIDAREREVRERLQAVQEAGDMQFELVDLTSLDRFGGDPAQFYDGVHMTPPNTRMVLAELDRAGLLERDGARIDRG